MLDQIIDALRRGAAPEALSLARVAVAEHPHDPRAHAVLAHAARANGLHDEARAAIDRAVALGPDIADLHLQRSTFLLDTRDLEAATEALARSAELDPNQFDVYIIQGQLALSRRDIAAAERAQKFAARIAPDHPKALALAGGIALLNGDGQRAQALLSKAATGAPDDTQVLYSLGFAHLREGQYAFAEQAFLRLVELSPAMKALRGMIADLMLQQQRPEEARAMLQPLLDDAEFATPALKRMVGELDLAMGRVETAATLLREAFLAEPRNARGAGALSQAWRIRGDFDEARRTLDEALAAHPTHSGLWQMRVGFEPEGSDAARAVIEQWQAAAPDDINALDALMHYHEAKGETEAMEALAERIVAREPGRASAEMRVIDKLLRTDPDGAVKHVQQLIAKASDEAKPALLPWLGLAQDRAGRAGEALMTWSLRNAGVADQRWPLTTPGDADVALPTAAVAGPGLPPTAFLWGTPGAGADLVAMVIAQAGYPLRADRFGARAPQDPLQNPDTMGALASGAVTPEAVLAQWQAALPARGVPDQMIIDWLPYWDNALLKVLRPLLPQATVLVALRDPRDALLQWIAFGDTAPFGLRDAREAAKWMAAQLRHVLRLQSEQLAPFAIIRTDKARADMTAFAAQVGGALGLEEIRVPDAATMGPERFPAGHWRQYARPLADAFAELSEVAQAFGYPAE